jgi:hypothetical protein
MMRKFFPFRVILKGCLPSALCVFLLSAQQVSAGPQAPGTAQSADQNSDADAKAAARKKKFEEDKRRLESAESQPAADSRDPQQTLFISPVLVNMLVQDTQKFSLFDIEGHNLTSKAEWSLSNTYVADLTFDGIPMITAKDHGTVTVRARVGSLSTEASVTVLSGDKLPVGTIRWQAPKIPGFKPTGIVQAVPTGGNRRAAGTPVNPAPPNPPK